MNFKNSMLNYLSEKGKNVNWVAKKLDVSVQTIYAKERPSINFLRQFCNLFDCYVITDGLTFTILDK
jgi:DNA-binding XRE family transcriptional regulator